MNSLIGKSVWRQMLQVEDLQNSINGGSAPLYAHFKESEDLYTIVVNAPSINVDDLHIEVVRNKVRIYNTLSFINENGQLMMTPVNFYAFEIPENGNQEMVEAFEEANGSYQIQIPKGGVKVPKRTLIPIKQRK